MTEHLSPTYKIGKIYPLAKTNTVKGPTINLKGGGLWFLFRSEIVFQSTRELEYLFFCRAKCKIYFQNTTLGYMAKTVNQIFFFSSTKIRIFFFSNIGNQNIFLKKKNITPPPPLQVKWSFPKMHCKRYELLAKNDLWRCKRKMNISA